MCFRGASSGLLLVGLFLTGCRKTSIEAAIIPDASGESSRVATANGAVTGPAMPEGWQWSQDRRTGDGFTLLELRWRHTTSAGNIFLYAKDYAVSEEETIASLSARDWRSYYEPELNHIRSLDVRPGTFAKHPALEVRAEGTDSEGIVVLLHEVYVPIRGHVLLTSAKGPFEEMVALAARLAGWREAIEFAALR